MIARGDHDRALVAAVGPVREATTGELTRRLLPADSFVHPPLPEGLAGGGVDGECLTTRRRDGEEATIRIERRRTIVLVVSVLASVPRPRDAQRVEVRRVDLIERGVPRAPRVSAPVAPLTGGVTAHQSRVQIGARLAALLRAASLLCNYRSGTTQ